ncbi:hypothetical protein AB0J90_26490 [Micromonospora sp. NPDC049523]
MAAVTGGVAVATAEEYLDDLVDGGVSLARHRTIAIDTRTGRHHPSSGE